jgi:hypothetical protein
MEPIRIFEEDGKWQADYGPGLSQTFPNRQLALESASRIAEREGREVSEVPAELAHELMRETLARLAEASTSDDAASSQHATANR